MQATYPQQQIDLVTISEARGLCTCTCLGNEVETVDADGNAAWRYDVATFSFTPGALLTPAMVQASPQSFLALSGNVDELASRLIECVQQYLDDAAKARGYDSCASACSYLNSAVPMFAAEAAQLHALRDACWVHMRQLQAKALTGDAEAVAALLAMPAGLPAPDFSAVPAIL